MPSAVPTAVPAPRPPAFDCEALRQRAYRSASGARPLFLRDRRVELRRGSAEHPELTRGEQAEAIGDTVVFTVVGSGAKVSLKVSAALKTLVGGAPEESFTQVPAISPEGKTYISDTGIKLNFNGAKASYSRAGEKSPWSGTEVTYAENRVTVNEKHGKEVVARVYVVDNGGLVLFDVTPAQVAMLYFLQEGSSK